MLAEKKLLTEKITEDETEYVLTIRLVTSISFNRFRLIGSVKWKRNYAEAQWKHRKPTTESVGCGTNIQVLTSRHKYGIKDHKGRGMWI